MVERRSPKSRAGGSNPSALVEKSDTINVLKIGDDVGIKMEQLDSGSSSNSKSKSPKKNFLENLKTEIKQITWTSRSDLFLFAKIIVIATFGMGLSIYGTDLFIKGFLNIIRKFFHFIFG